MLRKACLLLLVLVFIPCISQAETVITKGSAIIGSDITLEEAKLIALNDARQKALNSLGVFVESQSKVVNYRLTEDEIKTITGAIMTSEIIESTKKVVRDVFILEMKVKFDISMSSFNQSLKNYQDRSKDRRTIKHLIKTIERLQQEIVKAKKGTPEVVEIVDEIEFSTKRLGELLTTKQVIDHELQIQEIYKKKVKNHFNNNVLPKLYNDIAKLLVWGKVPSVSYTSLKLKYIKHDFDNEYEARKEIKEKIKNQLGVYFNCFEPITKEYDKQNLKVHPKFYYYIEFKIPVHIYINEDKIKKYFKVTLLRQYSRPELLIEPQYSRSRECKLEIDSMFVRVARKRKLERLLEINVRLPKNSLCWDISLSDKFNLSNIENIEYRIGRVSHQDIKFYFFDEARNVPPH